MDGAISATSGKCIRNVNKGDRLIFGETIAIGVDSVGNRDDNVRRSGIPFHLVCTDANINNEVRGGFNLAVLHFGEVRAAVVLGGCSRFEKIKWHC